jgi:hypothetical protein
MDGPKGVNDLNQLGTHVITIEWVNEQKDDCEFEYKGKFILNGNRFGFLTDKVSYISGEHIPPRPFFGSKAATVVAASAACRRFLFCKIQARPRPWGPCQPWRP